MSALLHFEKFGGRFGGVPYPIPLPIKQYSRLLKHLRIHFLLARALLEGRGIRMYLTDQSCVSIN